MYANSTQETILVSLYLMLNTVVQAYILGGRMCWLLPPCSPGLGREHAWLQRPSARPARWHAPAGTITIVMVKADLESSDFRNSVEALNAFSAEKNLPKVRHCKTACNAPSLADLAPAT